MNNHPSHRKPIKGLMRAILVLIVLVGLAIYFAPWYLDNVPPSLAIKGIEEGKAYRGVLELTLDAQDEKMKIKRLNVQVDEQEIVQRRPGEKNTVETVPIDTTNLKEGEHSLTVKVVDGALRRNTTIESINFTADNTPPALEIEPRPAAVKQGYTLAIFVKSDEPLSGLSGRLFGRDTVFYPSESDDKLYRGLVGVSVYEKVKTHPLEITGIDRAGNQQTKQGDIQVKKTKFEKGVVNLPKRKKRLLTDTKARSLDKKKTTQAYSKEETKQLWNNMSIRPTTGWVTSSFGKRRVYNNGVLKSVHLGLDIANKTGTPVKAINSGIVALAESLPIHGISVIINHGQGVYSAYNHLSETQVNVNDRVEKGQIIGLIGETGQATGPHLHWGVRVNGINVNPEEWQRRDFEYTIKPAVHGVSAEKIFKPHR